MIWGEAFYFTSNRADAEGYDYNRDYDEPQVLDVYLSMQNPYYIGESPKPAGFTDEAGEEFRAAVQAAGYDGIIDRTVNAKFMESEGYSPDAVHYVVFEPTQIKSAVDNNGDFDTSDPDIRFSKSDVEQTGNPIMDAVSKLNAERLQRWAQLFNPSKITAAMKAKWPDIRPAMLQMLPRNYLADIGGHLLPSLRRYNAQVAQMEAQRNELLGVAHETADKWRKLVGKQPGPSAKLADLMHEATLMGVDPSESKFVPTMTRQTYNILMSRAKAFIQSRKRRGRCGRPGHGAPA